MVVWHQRKAKLLAARRCVRRLAEPSLNRMLRPLKQRSLLIKRSCMQSVKLTVLLDMRLALALVLVKKAKAGSASLATKARLACLKRSRTPGYVIYLGKSQLDVYHVV